MEIDVDEFRFSHNLRSRENPIYVIGTHQFNDFSVNDCIHMYKQMKRFAFMISDCYIILNLFIHSVATPCCGAVFSKRETSPRLRPGLWPRRLSSTTRYHATPVNTTSHSSSCPRSQYAAEENRQSAASCTNPLRRGLSWR